METIAPQAPAPAGPDETAEDTLAVIKATIDESLRLAGSAWALLRTEIRLARSSALVLVWLGFALLFFGIGAWVATSAAIAAGVYELTGNAFYGVGSVALLNIVGAIVVVQLMRGCWRDIALPRTRRAIAELRAPAP
jgi:hypothetical protein